MAMILKYLVPGAVGIAIGLFLGMKIERADWADRMSGLEREHRQELVDVRREEKDKLVLAKTEHERTVERYREILAEARASAARSREIAQRREERINEINTELESLQDLFSGRSVCEWDDDDVRLWNDAAEAINRGIREGVSGTGAPDNPGG